MFQQKQIEEYQNITAPTELKDRVKFSVNKARRTMRQKMMIMSTFAAGITLFFVSKSLLGNSSTILLVNDVVVTREALLIENQDSVLLTTNVGQQRSLPICIPMVMEVKEKTELTVNVGTLIRELDENQYSEETTSLELSEDAKVYWILDGELDKIQCYTVSAENSKDEIVEYWPMLESDREKSPVCTIKRGRTTDTYVVEYRTDTQSYTIRKL